MRWRDFDNLDPLPDNFFNLHDNGPRRVHFIGIGGIGMSALAFVLLARGHQVSGSDANESPTLQRLREAGAKCEIGHSEEYLQLLGQNANAVIFGSAITQSNPEYAGAKKLGIPVWHRAQLLANFVNSAKLSIAVSGTHGKSTTSAMVAHILERCGKNPTAILGAEYPPFQSNARIGDPDLVVVEADESDGSFTLLHPTIAIVTNVEPEHLENYDNSENELWRAFEIFVSQAKREAILNADDAKTCVRLASAKSSTRNPCSYSVEADPAVLRTIYSNTLLGGGSKLRATDLTLVDRHTQFVLDGYQFGQTELIEGVRLGIPGRHNVSNALAALLAVISLKFQPKLSLNEAAQTLESFYGVKRRFQFIGEANDIFVYDDYAHHPTEVASTLRAARDFLQRPVAVIFQPHRYSRTQHLGRDFGPSFEAADKVIITQLYSAFEEPIPGVSGRIVFDAAVESFPGKEIHYVEDLAEAKALALRITGPGDVLFTMGAGNVSGLAPQLVEELGTATSAASYTYANESLARRTTMKIGGPAKIWLEPQSEEELQAALSDVARQGTPLFVLGAGSNLLAGDSGFDGAVLHLGKGFVTRRMDGDRMIVGGATMLPKLTHFALDNNRANFEWACGIPGTVGGSLWGNAGARGWNGSDFESRDCAADLESVVAFERDGTRHVLGRKDIEFAYRKSSLGDLIVTEATWALPHISEQEAGERRAIVKELLARRKATQPVNAACAGCIWKNPKVESGEFAGCGTGALVEKLGLKGMQFGGAQVSEIHGNFIVNTGGATYADVMKLIEHIEAIVVEKTGIRLEREVRFIRES